MRKLFILSIFINFILILYGSLITREYFHEKKVSDNFYIKSLNLATVNLSLEEKLKKRTYEFLLKDDSITKYLDPNVSFNNVKYKPQDLIKIDSDFILDKKGNSFISEKIKTPLYKLSKDFYRDFGKKIEVVSSYRSYEYQSGVFSVCDEGFCAKPGHSEHQSGLAIDLFETSNEEDFLSNPDFKIYFDWLNKNAYKYGFINTYSKGIEVDGYENEPWHWRYVGYDFAKYLKSENKSFAEFYYDK